MAGPDDKDTTCADLPVPDYEQAIGRSIAGMRVGIPREYRLQGMSAEVDALWAKGAEWLAEAGAQLTEISLPATASALPAYILNPAEASSNLARYDGVRYGLRVPGSDVMEMYGRTRAAGFSAGVRRRVMIGTYVLSAGYYDEYYLRAQKVRTLVKADFERCFSAGIDAILTPSAPTPAFAIGEQAGTNPTEMHQRRFHRSGEYGGAASRFGSSGAQRRGIAIRPSADRPSVRRRTLVGARRRYRARCRQVRALNDGGRGGKRTPRQRIAGRVAVRA